MRSRAIDIAERASLQWKHWAFAAGIFLFLVVILEGNGPVGNFLYNLFEDDSLRKITTQVLSITAKIGLASILIQISLVNFILGLNNKPEVKFLVTKSFLLMSVVAGLGLASFHLV